jgi:GT2 family glycosyltransferase
LPRTSTPSQRTVPVLAILVCHNGKNWLPSALSALEGGTVRPRHVLAVDTGSTDGSAELLAQAASDAVLDGVIDLPVTAGFAEAVNEAVARATTRWGDPGEWIWLLHDDCAPEPDCLDILLRAADAAPGAGVLGPLAVDWGDPRLIVEAGLSTDAAGHRQRGLPDADEGAPREQSCEVLAMPSAGMLIRHELWTEVGGFDPGFRLLREDLDFGWRANAAGSLVLCVPRARLRHARALGTRRRTADALHSPVGVAERAYGLRTFLLNCGTLSFVVGLLRIPVLCLLRAAGFLLVRDTARARAEIGALGYLLSGRAQLRSGRDRRNTRASVRGLLTSRFARLRNAVRGGVVQLVRERVASEAALGRLPEPSSRDSAWIPPESRYERGRPVGPQALPAGALRTPGRTGPGPKAGLRGSGLRKPPVVAVALPEQAPAARRPSPGARARAEQELLFVDLDRRRVLAATVFAPPVVLIAVLTLVALLQHSSRFGLALSGGHLLPVGGLGEVWSTYLASWHPVSGGTGTAAPGALAVLGVLGAVLAPLGGPPAVAALLLIGDAPLSALVAYAATRRLRIHRWLRAGVAAAYALLPVATAAVAQGRLGVVVVHVLLPAVLAGLVALLRGPGQRWLNVAVTTALALAVTGAFTPLAPLVALAGFVVAFVVFPSAGPPARRVASLAIVVLLPLALLLPWLPALFAHPELLLRGVGTRPPASGTQDGLLASTAGGLLPAAVVPAVAVFLLVLRPTRHALPGLGVVLLGAAGLVPALRAGTDAGVPLLFVGAGLLAVVLACCLPGTHPQSGSPGLLSGFAVAGGAVVLVLLGSTAVLTGRGGALDVDAVARLAPSLTRELADTGRAVLVLNGPDEPVRLAGGRMPRFGDDALVAVQGTRDRLDTWQRGLLAGSRAAVLSAVNAGVLFVVLPAGADGSALRQAAGDLVAAAPPTAAGRQVLRLQPPSGQVVLISPERARWAVDGGTAAGEASGGGVSPVDAFLPDVRVRVSDGPPGRLLVLAAQVEAGWQATVDGERVPIVRAWGQQVAVAVPAHRSDVVIRWSSSARDLLLLGQVAAVLFTLLTAIPGRRRSGSPAVSRRPR